MYQSFTGISDSLWIYWAHSLVCDWQRKRCENHLHNWIHGAFNTTFDNKQWFLTLNRGERCQNLGVHFGHSEGSWAFCSSPVFVSGIICIWWTSVLQSHWWVSLNHMFNWLWSWGYLGIHWNVFYGLLLLLLKSPTAGSVQLMLHAETHSRFSQGWTVQFLPRKISWPTPSANTSFLVTFIFSHELEVLLNILFIFHLLSWPRGQAWEEWFFKEMFLSSQPHPLPA